MKPLQNKEDIMTKNEEYEMIINMIDHTQKEIAKQPKGKFYLMQELEQLQEDLAALRITGRPKRQLFAIKLEGGLL